ncbi:MAG: glycogen synthase GlgA [Blastocatellia bacterium]|nr:glycogen synthase GlgA [Blastocatellia bacterium]MCS7157898.1 glycogen synthase GlgA [Blastocatellia bacterium]MCX7753365.1 glycogen synthase GlgA [Blastocatellia bacterium]MDW8168024.1 glycogen synthase GlgA [Acidobacteriota bacterium]MDW8255764.1 glycogen synthase GlgA [Acidobacteriota bacterium]
MRERLQVIFAASEATPYAKTGGLADVAGALPRALAKLGVEVKVILPRYRGERAGAVGRCVDERVDVPFAFGTKTVAIYADEHRGVSFYFVDAPEYFDRPGIYGPNPNEEYPDNVERYAFFSRAVIEWARRLNPPPDLIHCNDWQTGFIPLYLRTTYREDPHFQRTKTLFTIHNIGYQGLFSPMLLERFGLSPEIYRTEGGIEFYGQASAMKAGIVFSTAISTVSRKYAEEIQTPEYGYGLDGLLRAHAARLVGILNGVDYEEWNPATDPFIAARYSMEDLRGKRLCKADLLRTMGLPEDLERPVIGSISRLVAQKGFDLVREAANGLLRAGVVYVLLGSGARELEEFFREWQRAHPDRVGVYVGFHNELAHKIEAGADMFLMPSRYEPCGLNQIYSLKYGTVPIVRATGGLDDTIEPFDPATRSGNGFKFVEYRADHLLAAVERALQVYADPSLWRACMENGMRADFSWDRSAAQYRELYERVIRGDGPFGEPA